MQRTLIIAGIIVLVAIGVYNLTADTEATDVPKWDFVGVMEDDKDHGRYELSPLERFYCERDVRRHKIEIDMELEGAPPEARAEYFRDNPGLKPIYDLNYKDACGSYPP